MNQEPRKPINLWLDDLQPAPEGWVWAKSVAEAWALLLENEVEEMSLDHDLGDGPTGKALLLLMIEQRRWSQQKPVVHSRGLYGRYCMIELIERYGPYPKYVGVEKT